MKMYGRASVAGLTGAVTWASIGANSVWGMQGLTSTTNWSETVVKDAATGKPKRLLVDELKREITIDMIPESDGTEGKNTKAIAAGSLPTPPPYSICTISGATDTELNDTFLVAPGARKSFTPTGDVKFTLTLRRYLECSDDEHTALSTEITS